MRRRGVGVAAVKSKQQEQKAFEGLGEKLEEANLQHVTTLLGTFKESLEEFARKHKRDINANPLFRNEFQKMCTAIGVDPLASNKGFWAQLLGVGDFYYELAVQIIEICLVTRHLNGGLMSLGDLTQRLRKRYVYDLWRHTNDTVVNDVGPVNDASFVGGKLDRISKDDVRTAVQKIHKLGAGFQIIESGGHALVVSVPMELSSDQSVVLSLAQGQSYVTLQELRDKLQWNQERIHMALNLMLQNGMAWVDRVPGQDPMYWFPSLWQGKQAAAAGDDAESGGGAGTA